MIVLDTHVLVWWVSDPDKLTVRAKKMIVRACQAGEVLVSSFSVWEIFMLVRKGRLSLDLDVNDWVSKIEQLSYVRFVPVDNDIAKRSVDLSGEFQGDPADRIIVATAILTGSSLITRDKEILEYSGVKAVW